MSIFLTTGAVEKLLNGQVMRESQMKPVLQVWDTHTQMIVREHEWARLWLTDGRHKIRTMVLASLLRNNTVGFGNIIQLLKFENKHPEGFVHIQEMKLIESSSDIVGLPNEDVYVELTSSDDDIVHDSQDTFSGKPLVFDEFKTFRDVVKAANVFVLDTRTTKDGIRAAITCFDMLITAFDKLLEDLCVRPKKTEARPSNESSEDLTMDQLRSNACKLIRFFIKWNVPQVLKVFRSATTEYHLRIIQRTLHKSATSLHQVTTRGFSCELVNDADFEWFS